MEQIVDADPTLPTLRRLAWRLGHDPRAYRWRVDGGCHGAAAYLASPIDLVPGIIPSRASSTTRRWRLLALRFALRGLPQRISGAPGAVGLTADDIDQDLRTVRSGAAWICGAVAASSLRGRSFRSCDGIKHGQLPDERSGTVSRYRYSRWDGSQQLPPFDADDVLEALSDDILAEGDVRRALQRLMQRGMRGTRGGDVPGLRRIVDRLRAAAAELERTNLTACSTSSAERLEEIVEQERAGIERRARTTPSSGALDAAPGPDQDQARMAEQVLRRPRSSAATASMRSAATWPGSWRACATTSSWTPMRGRFQALTDELRQQMLQTYLPGDEGGRRRHLAGRPRRRADMVRDLNELLEKHAAARTRAPTSQLSWTSTASYFPPAIETVDQLIDHLHRQAVADGIADGVSMSPEMRAELQQMMDELLRDDRLRWDMARAGRRRCSRCVRTSPRSASRTRLSGDEPHGPASRR